LPKESPRLPSLTRRTKTMNPNNIKVGDTIEVQQAWEDETGNYHDEFPEVKAINDSTGELTLDYGRKDLNDFLAGAEFFAKDYKPEPTNP